jgi:uncharacterized membrane protein YeaQ/YmgE (transglycosylase-associated protein family)
MGLIFWLLIGAAAGAIAKMITPQQERGGWVSSLAIGLVGSLAGKFAFGLIGLGKLLGDNLINDLVVAVAGSVILLFVYHKFFAHKWKLPI